MYGKLFKQMYDSTIADDWQAMIVFQQLIILADQHGIVDMTPRAISRVTNIPLDIIEHGIQKLGEPDTKSRSKITEGRRIELIDDDRKWGWHLVNYEYYRTLASQDDKREKDRLRIAEKRKEKKNKDLKDNRKESQASNSVADISDKSQNVADVAHIDVNINTDVKKPSSPENKFSDDDMKFARWMILKIKDLMPKTKEPNLNKWANTIRLMRERDKRTYQEMMSVFTWANNDHFWQTNIRSPEKLKIKFDELEIKMKNSGGSHADSKAGGRLSTVEQAHADNDGTEKPPIDI